MALGRRSSLHTISSCCLDDDDDDWDFYSVTLAFRQTTGNKADGGQ
jgi:hypothetical protein